MVPALVGFAIFAAALGGLLLSQATAGVGAIGVGCLVAIIARIVEADAQHKEITHGR